MATQVTPSGLTATTDLTTLPILGKKVESAFYLATQRFPYWGVEFSGLTPVLVDPPKGTHDDFTLAVTNDWIVLISTRVIDLKWTNNQLSTVLAHELMHLWQKHDERFLALGLDRSDREVAMRWNVACDFEINDDLRDAGCEFPLREDGTISGCFPESIGAPLYLTAEEYYALLLKHEEQQQPQQGQGQPKPGAGKGKPGQGKPKPQNGQGCGSGAGNRTELEKELGLGGDESDEEGYQEGEIASYGKSEAEKEALVERLNNDLDAAAGDASTRGRVPKGLALDVDRRKKASSIDWRRQLSYVLRNSVEEVAGDEDTCWSRLSRRQLGEFLQPTHTEPVIKVMVVLDTSGSMVQLLGAALTQVRAVFEAAHADVTWVQCDAAIAEVLTLTSVADIDRITLKGGGGTDFRPPFALVDKLPDSARPQVMVYVTDGQGTAPTYAPSYKVIWALLGGSVAPASWGTAVLIPREG